MRFLADGPNIPDELLEARDRGEVVFLCGAGVSYPAGMPTFLGLAQYVIQELGTPLGAPSREMLSIWDNCEIPEATRPSLDQIFNLLQLEYEVSEIEYLIAKRLKTRPRTDVSTHRTILRLSRSADGRPQIVTTNFDLLFQYADKKLTHYVPPNLPNLAYGQGLNGLAYLHGRINSRIRKGEALQGLVVSSSDFGQAYLAEGWATRFVLDLLDRYIVVLLGYSASDPPVRYLLQGLRKARRRTAATIYAFDRGAEEKVRGNWRDSEVRVLAYPETDDKHSALWDTLEAWAERADDLSTWRQGVADLAKRGPRNLEMHERGQVASLVRTIDGAKLFAEADPPPPGEWLCVLDKYVRYGKVVRDVYSVLPDFDPLIEYGLDDDPPRPQGNQPDSIPPGDDLLSLRATDPHRSDHLRLAGMPHPAKVPLQARLFRLALWIVKIAHEPVALWWASRHSSLHPFLVIRIEQHIQHKGHDFPQVARSIWHLLNEKFRTIQDDDFDRSLYEVNQRIKDEGWTNGALRAFERSVTPYLKTESRSGLSVDRPPEKDWPELGLSDIADFDVGFPYISDIQSDIPDEFLPEVYRIGRRQLELAAGVLSDIKPIHWRNLTLSPKDEESVMRGDDPGVFLLWFRGLLDRMAVMYPELVRADVALWPEEDPYFFDTLRFCVWSYDTPFTEDEVGDGLLSLSDKIFWITSHRRELLHLLRRRWRGLSAEKRKMLEKRIVDGRERYDGESEENYKRWSSIQSATILGWLSIKHCDLSNHTKAILPRLRNAHPDWSPEWDENADDDGIGEGGWVKIDSDASVILHVPLSQVIPLAKAHTISSFSEVTDYKPFEGLTKLRPNRAVAALTYAAKKGDYPFEFWRSALREWPDEARPRLIWLFGARLARLPSEIVVNLRFDLFPWLQKHLSKLARRDQARALSILDALLDKLFEGGTDATKSGIGDVRVAGDSQGWSRKTMYHAINSPVGVAARMLLDFLKSQDLEKGSGIPSEVKFRLKRLVSSPGEGRYHAICVIAERLEWLHYLDPEWARTTIVLWFDPGHPYSEPAWNGFLHRTKPPASKLFSLLRSHFLNVFKSARTWKWNDEGLRVLHKLLVISCLWREHDEVYLTFAEVRRTLQLTDDTGRSHATTYLTDLIESNKNEINWHQFGKRFLKEAWPKEIRLQTENTSLDFARLAGVTGDDFPEVVQAILPRLVPIYGDSWFLYRVVSRRVEKEFELATRFPEATLALVNKLVPDSPPEPPFDLDFILEKIAAVEPSLRQDWRWRRLKRIARQE